MCEDFITSEHDKGYIDRVGKDYLMIKDIYSEENTKIEVDENTAEHFKNEFSYGEVIYVFYDKSNKKLV